MPPQPGRQGWDGGDNSNTQTISVLQNLVVAVNTLNNTVGQTFPNWVTPPANSTASGVAGQVSYSGSSTATAYLYVCLVSGQAGVAQWGRTQLTTGW